MKTRILLVIAFLTVTATYAQDIQNYLIKIDQTKLGAYLSLSGRFSSVESNLAGFGDFKAAVTFNGNWSIGIMSSGLYYDKSLNHLVNDGTYHLYASYGALFVEKIFSLNNDFKISLSIASGKGEAYYQYDKDYRKEKVWSEETIDRTTFAIFEPGIEIQHRIYGNWWIGVVGSYRNTSPLRLVNTDDSLLQKLSGGISFKWGVF